MRSRRAAATASVLFLLTGCGSGDDSASTDAASTRADAPSSPGTEEARAEEAGAGAEGDGADEDVAFLAVGDTAELEPILLPAFDLTVDDFVLTDTLPGDLADEVPQTDTFFLLDVTVVNASEETIATSDLVHDLRVTDDLESSGSSIVAFDDAVADELAPGGSYSGQFWGDVYEGDTYYVGFRDDTADGVEWEIAADDAG
ncbi:MAG: hypothetical protein ACTHYM_11905 [Actinomycetaceae bacterium]